MKRFFVLLALISFVSSCAPKPFVLDVEKYVWPPAPETPRVKLVAVVSSDLDFRKPSFAEKIFGKDAIFGFSKPHGITSDKNGNIYVSDTGMAKVSVFNRETGTIGTLFNPMGFNLPLGLAYEESLDWIAVADAGANLVSVIDVYRNKLVYVLGQKNEFVRPVSVAFDGERQRLLVADTGSHSVKAFDFKGNFLFEFGEKGVAPGKFYFPTGITVDKEGFIYVVNSFNFRFDIFDANGNFVKSVGEHGDRPGMFARPKDVAVNSEGYIFVSDAAFNNIQIFDRDGNMYLFFGQGGDAPGAFSNLYSVSIDKDDKVYATDQINRRIQIFQYLKDAGINNDVAPAKTEEAEKETPEPAKNAGPDKSPESGKP